MVNGPLPQGSGDLMNRRHTGTLRSAFGLVACLAIVASAFSASASALTPAMGLEAPRVATLAAAKHRRPTQKSSSVQKKSAKSAPPKAVRRPPKGPKVATPPPPRAAEAPSATTTLGAASCYRSRADARANQILGFVAAPRGSGTARANASTKGRAPDPGAARSKPASVARCRAGPRLRARPVEKPAD